ncbi:MAG: ABC transporter permease subunit [Chloroflexi bacterium]|nr:ABC transporter permease subunit [Chloroflexota bacterium]
MIGFGALLKKELAEQLRTYKLLIVAVVFLLLGMTTPLMTKYLPELIKLAGEEIKVEFPTPTAVMALKEYADNIVQIGLLVAVLIGMGSIARERERGTAAMILSKPVSRGAFVVAKLLAGSVTLTLSLAAGALAGYFYTLVLFGAASTQAFIGLNVLLALFLMMCFSVTLFFSSLLKSSVAAGGLALAFLVGQSLIASIPRIGEYFPGQTISWGVRMVSGAEGNSWPAVAVTTGVILLAALLSWLTVNRQEL